MSLRVWMSVFTAVLLAVIVYVSRHEIVHAWQLLEEVDAWILLLLIPGQLFVYYVAGEMVFSYLKTKGSIHHLNGGTLARMALEMNFVNHILPSAGVSGASYMNWRLGHYGITLSRATMAQVVRFAAAFAAYIILLLIAVVVITIDGGVNRWVILFSSLLISVMTITILVGMYLLSSEIRIKKFSSWIHRTVNMIVRKLTFGRHKSVLDKASIEQFFEEMHNDYLALRKDRRILIKPFLWGVVFTIAEVSLFMITFWALGIFVNPAVILIAYGLAVLAGFFFITPGGAGAYEAIMVSFLAIAGVSSGIAIAGVLLTRVILLLGTIILGYAFYQHAIFKYAKPKTSR